MLMRQSSRSLSSIKAMKDIFARCSNKMAVPSMYRIMIMYLCSHEFILEFGTVANSYDVRFQEVHVHGTVLMFMILVFMTFAFLSFMVLMFITRFNIS
jgi:hypothetical protein